MFSLKRGTYFMYLKRKQTYLYNLAQNRFISYELTCTSVKFIIVVVICGKKKLRPRVRK
jgi:hypothetical protein